MIETKTLDQRPIGYATRTLGDITAYASTVAAMGSAGPGIAYLVVSNSDNLYLTISSLVAGLLTGIAGAGTGALYVAPNVARATDVAIADRLMAVSLKRKNKSLELSDVVRQNEGKGVLRKVKARKGNERYTREISNDLGTLVFTGRNNVAFVDKNDEVAAYGNVDVSRDLDGHIRHYGSFGLREGDKTFILYEDSREGIPKGRVVSSHAVLVVDHKEGTIYKQRITSKGPSFTFDGMQPQIRIERMGGEDKLVVGGYYLDTQTFRLVKARGKNYEEEREGFIFGPAEVSTLSRDPDGSLRLVKMDLENTVPLPRPKEG